MAKYIFDTTVLEKEDIALHDLGILLFISELPNKTIENELKEYICTTQPNLLELYVERGYAKLIKSKKNIWEAIRLSKKGEEMVGSLFKKPILPISEEFFDILNRLYTDYNIKSKIKNKKKTTFYINEWFLYKQAEDITYTTRQFEAVLMTYLDSFEHNKLIYVKNSLALFFNPEGAYISKWHVSHCPFEDFIQTSDRSLILKNYNRLEQ